VNTKYLLLPFLVLGTVGFTTNPAFRTDKSTVALWNFDEKDETTLESDSEDSITLTLPMDDSGEIVTTFAPGKFGRSLYFPGTAWATSEKGVIGLESEITVEAWIKISTDAFGKPMGIVENMDYSNKGFRLLIRGDGKLSFMIESQGFETGAHSADPLPTGEWLYVAGTYDGSNICVYVNGELRGKVPLVEGVIAADDMPLRVGFADAVEHMLFSGEIDALRISNIVREIQK